MKHSIKKLLLIAVIVACGNNQAHAMAYAQVQEGFILQTLRNWDQIISAACKVVAKTAKVATKTALLAGGAYLVYRTVQKIKSQKTTKPVIVVDPDKDLIRTQFKSARNLQELNTARRKLNNQYHPDNTNNPAPGSNYLPFIESVYRDLAQIKFGQTVERTT